MKLNIAKIESSTTNLKSREIWHRITFRCGCSMIVRRDGKPVSVHFCLNPHRNNVATFLNPRSLKLKHIAIAAALALAGCSTQAELACQNGQALAGYTPQETCLLGQIQRANMNAEAAAALGVVAVGVGTYAAIEASRPRTQTYLVTPTGPFSNNYMITGPYGE